MIGRVFSDAGEHVGTIEQTGAGWRATDQDGQALGTFPTPQDAAGAALRVHAHETTRKACRSEEELAAALDDMAGRWRAEARAQAALDEEAGR